MKTKNMYIIFFIFFMSVLVTCATFNHSTYGAILYKSYIIRYDRGWDILCDPYVVKKDDWIYKLFREKGEIANQDFPKFLRLFKRLNPHIDDIDKIRPGQHIVIPLKKVSRGALPGQSSGVVTIPFLTNSNIPEDFHQYSVAYRVKRGDCVSVLIYRKFSAHDTASYNQGIKLFRLINPKIKNLNRIYVGQTIRIPDPAIQNQPWYPSLFNRTTGNLKPVDMNRPTTAAGKTIITPILKDQKKKSNIPLSKVASVLDAKLLNSGIYYFPRPGQEDVEIDLSRSPLMEFKDGTRLFFPMDAKNSELEITMAKSFWKDLHIVNTLPDDSLEHIFDAVLKSFKGKVLKNRLSFSDRNVNVEVRGEWILDQSEGTGEKVRRLCITLIDHPEEETPVSIVRYLDQNGIMIKDVLKGKSSVKLKSGERDNKETATDVRLITALNRRSFVNDFLTAMDYKYVPNISISFLYAGIPIKTVSNLAAKSNENSFLVDFGEFYGDAVHSIEKQGFNVIQIKNADGLENIIKKLLQAMHVSYTKNPVFLAAKRPTDHNITLTIPGFLMDDEESKKTLLATVPLNDEIVRFLSNKRIKTMRVELNEELKPPNPFAVKKSNLSVKNPGPASGHRAYGPEGGPGFHDQNKFL